MNLPTKIYDQIWRGLVDTSPSTQNLASQPHFWDQAIQDGIFAQTP